MRFISFDPRAANIGQNRAFRDMAAKQSHKVVHHGHEWVAMTVPLLAERQIFLTIGASVIFLVFVIFFTVERG